MAMTRDSVTHITLRNKMAFFGKKKTHLGHTPIPWRPINPNGAPLQDLQNGLKPKVEPKLDA